MLLVQYLTYRQLSRKYLNKLSGKPLNSLGVACDDTTTKDVSLLGKLV